MSYSPKLISWWNIGTTSSSTSLKFQKKKKRKKISTSSETIIDFTVISFKKMNQTLKLTLNIPN